MTGSEPLRFAREDWDASLLRLYRELGSADSYTAIVASLAPEIEHMLGYGSLWLQIIQEDQGVALTLDFGGGPIIEVMKKLLEDERFRLTLHGEDFVVVPIGDDPWLHEILESGDVHVTEDARTHPLTDKDLIAVTDQRSVVCLPLGMAERTLGWLVMGTFGDEGVRVPDADGLDYLRRLANHVGVAMDRVRFLGERMDAQASLERLVAELQFSSFLLDSVVDGVIVRDAGDGSVLYLNDAMCRLAGMERHEITAAPVGGWARTEDIESVQRHLGNVRKAGSGEMETTTRTGERLPVEIRSSVVVYRGRQAILSMVSDISERKAAQATIEYMALHDPLTDLANRALLQDRLELAMAHGRRSHRPLALMFLDVDDFKTINDSAGHAVGDMVLQEIAQRLREVVRADDTIARFGGDEFTLVLPDIDSAEAACEVARKVLESFREPFGVSERIASSASLGIAMYMCDDTTVRELMRNADLAMYCAKESGRAAYRLYDESMNERAEERFALKGDLEIAVAEGGLELHYQPIVRLTDGAIVGAEALCRWTHPKRGPVPPATFIPLAEESGAIHQLGEWVLREACDAAAGWQRPDREVGVSVNLSPLQLGQAHLAAVVRAALEGSGLPPSRLQLEITETTAMRDAPYLARAFGELRDMGVRIAIDDFGTGYSSLDYLMRFPVDILKVDRAFVRDVCEDPGCLAIAGAVVSLGRALGLEVIAEGIETEEQRQALIAAACPLGQGFLFSRGVQAEVFRALL